METRANYVAVGVSVLLVLAGMLFGFLWIAGVQLNAQFTYYQTHASGSVSGLSAGAPVRLNGIDVGSVAGATLDPANPELVTLLLKVRDGVEIHSDATASVESQGFTGVNYVEISGGTLASQRLKVKPGERYPTIAYRPSRLEQLFASAPEVLAHLLIIANRVEAMLDDKNRMALAETLANIRDATSTVAGRDQDINRLISDAQETLHNLASASTTANVLLAKLGRVSSNADRLFDSANSTFNQATKLANDLDAAVKATRPGLEQLTTTDTARLNRLLLQSNQVAASLNRLSHVLERNPQEVLFGARTNGYKPP